MKFREGELVMVKVSGLHVGGMIKKVLPSSEYLVEYEGGAEDQVPERIVKRLADEHEIEKLEAIFELQKAQKNKRSPRETTAARRSPGRRSPARNQSPARKARASPSRRPSPPRIPKLDNRVLKISLEDVDLKQSKLQEPLKKPTSNTVVTTKKNLANKNESKSNPSLITQDDYPPEVAYKFTEKLILPEIPLQKMDKLSDEELEEERSSVMKTKELRLTPARPTEYFNRVGALFCMLALPAFTLFLHMLCEQETCSFFKPPDLSDYQYIETFYNISATLLYPSFLLTTAALSLIPFGGKRVIIRNQSYCMNGLLIAFLISTLLIVVEYNKFVKITDIVVDNHFQLLSTAVACALLLPVVLFIASKFKPLATLNPKGMTSSSIYDFFIGREINPRIFKLDVKLMLIRSSFIAVLLLNSIYLFRSLEILTLLDLFDLIEGNPFAQIHLAPAVFINCFFQIFYALDNLAFEYQLSTSFKLQSEGCGYWTVMWYILYPFMVTTSSKYLLEHETECSILSCGIPITMFIVGYVMYRGSNSLKHSFRTNPYNHRMASLQTIPTAVGKKLIADSYWGIVRHPNYFGDILIHLAFSAICRKYPAGLCTLPVILLLIHRTNRDDYKCKNTYGSSWERYCSEVKYKLVKQIY